MSKTMCVVSLFLLLAGVAQADVISASTADAQILSAGAGDQGSGSMFTQAAGIVIKAGRDSGANGRNVATVLVFQLPDLGAGQSFGTGSLTFNVATNTGDYGADLYGINAREASTVLTSDFYFGAALDTSSDVTKLQDDILKAASPTGMKTSTDITAWLNTQYAGGANAGKYVFLRLSAAAGSGIFDIDNGFSITSANATSNQPFLTYEAIPEPAALTMIAFGGLSILWLKRRFC
jgi:hypothetical protein